MRRFGTLLCVTAISVFATAAASFASAATASGLKLCVPAKEGKMVLTPVKGACKSGYKLTKLGGEGKAGAAGPEGKAGVEGKAGAEGKSGVEGKTGVEGKQGPAASPA